ncbi:MAG: hypothetical protein ACREXI_11380 [Caldimonas sp.]
MAVFQGLIFLVFGSGLLWVDWQSLSRGWLPCGPKGLDGRVEFRRNEQPVLFWLMFLLYGGAGLALLTFSLRLLIGSATPLPLH